MRLFNRPRRRLSYYLISPSEIDEAITLPLAEAGIDHVTPPATADVTIVDLAAHALDQGRLSAVINTSRQTSVGTALIFLASADQYDTAAVTSLLRTDVVVQPTAAHTCLIRSIRDIAERGNFAREIGVRARAMATLGMGGHSPGISSVAPQIVMLATPGPLALKTLTDLSARVSVCATIKGSQTLRSLESRQADALVVLAAPERRPQATIVKLLRRHAELFDLPIIALEESCGGRQLAYWQGVGADDVLLADQTSNIDRIITRLRTRRANSLFLRESLAYMSVNDGGAVSRLSSNRLFEACLAERLAAERRPGCIGALRLIPTGGTAENEAISEVASCIAMAAEPTDLITRVGPDLFLLSLPDCDQTTAGKTLKTLSRMVADLRFGSSDDPCTYETLTSAILLKQHTATRDAIRAAVRGLRAPAPEATAAAY